MIIQTYLFTNSKSNNNSNSNHTRQHQNEEFQDTSFDANHENSYSENDECDSALIDDFETMIDDTMDSNYVDDDINEVALEVEYDEQLSQQYGAVFQCLNNGTQNQNFQKSLIRSKKNKNEALERAMTKNDDKSNGLNVKKIVHYNGTVHVNNEIHTNSSGARRNVNDNDKKTYHFAQKILIQSPESETDSQQSARFAMRNLGGLTRPIPESHMFANMVLTIIRNFLGHQDLHKNSLLETHNEVLGSIKLHAEWKALAQNLVPGISDMAIDCAFVLIIKKMVHSRGGLYIRTYTTQQGSAHHSRLTRRQQLKSVDTVKTFCGKEEE
jgi:hypothetical protein